MIVDDTQLSLAIGKKGQNVRLAAKLLGWKIDIKSEEEKRQEVEQQMQAMSGGPTTPIEQVTELGDGIIQKLVAAGITTVEALADMTPEQLEEIPGIGEKTLEKISVAVRHYFGHFEEGEEGAPTEEAPEGAAAETADTETPATGSDEVPTPQAAAGTAEAELENAQEVFEEAEQERAAEAENEELDAGEEGAAEEADAQSMTAAELAVDNVPVPGESELPALDREDSDKGGEEETAE